MCLSTCRTHCRTKHLDEPKSCISSRILSLIFMKPFLRVNTTPLQRGRKHQPSRFQSGVQEGEPLSKAGRNSHSCKQSMPIKLRRYWACYKNQHIWAPTPIKVHLICHNSLIKELLKRQFRRQSSYLSPKSFPSSPVKHSNN